MNFLLCKLIATYSMHVCLNSHDRVNIHHLLFHSECSCKLHPDLFHSGVRFELCRKLSRRSPLVTVVGPPLWRLLHLAVTAPPLNLYSNGLDLGLGPLLLLLWERQRREREQRVAQWPDASVGLPISYDSHLAHYFHFPWKTRHFLH